MREWTCKQSTEKRRFSTWEWSSATSLLDVNWEHFKFNERIHRSIQAADEITQNLTPAGVCVWLAGDERFHRIISTWPRNIRIASRTLDVVWSDSKVLIVVEQHVLSWNWIRNYRSIAITPQFTHPRIADGKSDTRYAFVDHYYHPFIVCCLCHRYFNYFKLKFSFFVSINCVSSTRRRVVRYLLLLLQGGGDGIS